MVFTVGDRARLAGHRVGGFGTVGSTNALALDAARAGDAGRHWFAAIEQTEGRGRRGRAWQSQKGNLAASLLLVFEARGDYSGLGFVAGVALCEALGALAPDLPITLKWPNDVLAGGRKLSGILLEAMALPAGRQAVVVGIGVNVVSAPEDTPYPSTALAAEGQALTAETLFTALSESFADNFVLWNNGNGLADVLEKWRGHAAGIGAPISVATPSGTVAGVFETLDARGRLMIRTGAGELTPVAAGDVYFGTTASSGAD